MMLQAKDTFRGIPGCKFLVNGCRLQIYFSCPRLVGHIRKSRGTNRKRLSQPFEAASFYSMKSRSE